MGTCIICGKPTDGRICKTHEEDVYFTFHGDAPDDLTAGRYYRGTVDGFAEFGVFVDIGPVTGLLHRSEIPQRLESLDWDPGDQVFVQVLEVHDNGNIDLGWSIRQEERTFRGHLHDPPEAGPDTDSGAEAATGDSEETTNKPIGDPEPVERPSEDAASEDEREKNEEEEEEGEEEPSVESADTDTDTETDSETDPDTTTNENEGTVSTPAQETDDVPTPDRTDIGSLDGMVDETVAVEGTVAGVRQTGGPTIFGVTDETGTIDCAAFEEAGERAYPAVDVGDVVRIVGEVERRRGELQIETSALEVLTGDDGETVEARLEAAMDERATPEDDSLLVDDPQVSLVSEDLHTAATTIRRAVIEARPVIIRHTATLDGYVAGTAIERALLPLIRDEHAQSDAEYHYVDRRPLDDDFYDIESATSDVTDMLEAADRHDEKHPLFVLVDAGSTRESLDGLELLDIYDAKSVIVDGGYADSAADTATDVLVSPTASGGDPITTGTLGSHLAALVNADVRPDLRHLPAASYWDDRPARYEDLAAAAGYDMDTLDDIRNAVTLEAFYQSYEDKRELIADLFWDDRNESLAAPISEQFSEKLESQLETAIPHLAEREEAGIVFDVLDVDDYTHRYDFPPVDLLVDTLHRRQNPDGEPHVTVAVKQDDLRVRSSEPVNVRTVAETVATELPEAGVTPRGGRDGRIEFLSGERDDVVDAAIEAIAEQLS
ncbi:DHH family phosphoesterase [Halanaeroarchaeum sulfurireducens]|uniref:Nucleic acid binding OB-fold tRNA/helicase-type n=1 Tax=Halanaeroarchaeum sulfurireducens TaxID=1604004 RepID=A0A0F7PE42_9EURY|nr:OB-fold nucleic acid binding domain-containing protein [Halanaeroarchaeum sulfurireducens]AKH97889.1 nucleic acid binding OB-fold tRNA/helicase-type [Halanaeroarchaeum sulfurireducens]ALG82283.1 nucleic acid binding OB-fold tRNA/helicase-type [Halanaeroarchaeum sulfurireducens]